MIERTTQTRVNVTLDVCPDELVDFTCYMIANRGMKHEGLTREEVMSELHMFVASHGVTKLSSLHRRTDMVNALAPEVLPTLATLFPELDFTEMANFIAEVNAS